MSIYFQIVTCPVIYFASWCTINPEDQPEHHLAFALKTVLDKWVIFLNFIFLF